MARRFDLGRALLAVGATLLLVSLFVDWYDNGQNGWEVFEALDLVLAGIAAGAVYAAIRADVLPGTLPGALAGAALVIVAVQLIDAPPAAGDGSPAAGAWLALAGSLLMCAGALLSRFAITIELREHDRRRRVQAVDRRGGGEPGAAPAPAAPASDFGRTETFTALRDDDDDEDEEATAR
jgi:peptidoglycan/LPS O-acetylase OafA/YrhL